MNLKLQYNKYALWLGVIAFLNLNCFYLVDSSNVRIRDITIIVELLFILWIAYSIKGKVKYDYKFLLFIPVILAITSSISAMRNYNQPFMLGFRAQRAWIVALLMYFPITKLLKLKKMRVANILNVIDNLNIIYTIIILAQYFLGKNIAFLHVNSNERYGSIRLYVSVSFLLISYFFHLSKILNGKKIYLKSVYIIVITLIIHLMVAKSRMGMVALLASSILVVLSIRTSIKKLLFVGTILFGMCAFLSSNIGQDIMYMAINSNLSEQDTSAIRDEGRKFFLKETFKDVPSALFGRGYANENWRKAVKNIRFEEGIGYVDNGIFGLMFYYGLIFIVWMGILHVRLIIDSHISNKTELIYFLLCGIFGMYTLFPACYTTDISFAIVCAMIESNKSIATEQNE